MNLHSVLLIFRREAADHLRDRRTLAAILVLPVVLYPILAICFLQLAQPEEKKSSGGARASLVEPAESAGSGQVQPDREPARLESRTSQSAKVGKTASSAAAWARILPLVIVVWALTGAFYPAVDSCAGERDRGTLETLLSSGARRRDIVAGKLLAVTAMSLAAAFANLLGLLATGGLLSLGLAGGTAAGALLGPPPLFAAALALVFMLPLSLMFSAAALAVASIARSAREGQYYLTPLLVVVLPAAILPMIPGARLDLGTSLIPVVGIVHLMRSLIEGDIAALVYAPTAIGSALICAWAAFRFTIGRFECESILSRDGERFSLLGWLRSALRNRPPTPTVGAAILCAAAIVLLRLVVGMLLPPGSSFLDFATGSTIVQLGVVAGVPLLLAIVFYRRRRESLLLRPVRPVSVLLAVLLALALHPVAISVSQSIQSIFPIGEETRQAVAPLEASFRSAPLWAVLLVAALIPAVCEELAFRGFILSGLRKLNNRWTAILLCSLIFGAAHLMLQQSLAASLFGVVIAYLALKTGSILPCIAYHFTHNALAMMTVRLTPEHFDLFPLLGWVYHTGGDSFGPRWPIAALGAVAAVGVFCIFRRMEEVPAPAQAGDE